MPVSEEAEKIFSVMTLPQIFPVLVSNFKASASQDVKQIFPVFLFTDIKLDAMTFFRLMLPVLPIEKSLLQVISDNSAFPVFVTSDMLPSQPSEEINTLPVVTFTERLR